MRSSRLSPALIVPALALAFAASGALSVLFPPSSARAQSRSETADRVRAPVVQARTNPDETPDYCHRQYEKCVADCDKDPLNKTGYDREACSSSCWSTYSGCGT